MPRSVRPYTPAQFEEVKVLVDHLAGQRGLTPAERYRLAESQADLLHTLREDRRRATGAARLPVAAS